MRKLTIIFFVLLFQHTSNAQTSTSFFVSTFGSDDNPGTKSAPFKTIQKAADVVRGVVQTAGPDIIVYIRGGVYHLDTPVTLDSRFSETTDCRVIFQSYEDEQPVFSGGVIISGWQPHENGIWKAPAKGLYFRQMYVNDRRAVRSRQPNKGDYYHVKGWDLAGRRIIVNGALVSQWEHFKDVEMVLQQRWAESYLRLKSYSVYGTMGGKDAYLTIQDEEKAILFPRPYPRKENNQVFHFENAYAFLDKPGEWFLDRAADLIYYKPRPGENMEFIRATVPVTETLVQLKGTPDQPVRNITFKGITFAYSTWTYPGEQGYLNMQAGQYNVKADSLNNQFVGRPPAAVCMEYTHNVQLISNTFIHLGATAIDLAAGTRNCRVEGNLIHEISGNGITVGKFTQDMDTEAHVPYKPEDKWEICTQDVISNNLIQRTGLDYYGTCAIAAGYPSGIKIEHNQIRDIPYTGISVGFGWTGKRNAMEDNRIAYNRISGVMNMLGDGAAIYTLSLQPGTIITGNYIFGIVQSEWADDAPAAGIYLDESSGGTDDQPFVLRNNFVEVSGFRRHHFHAIGDIVIDDEYNYLHQKGASEIVEQAGLEPAYRNLNQRVAEQAEPFIPTWEMVMMTDLKNEAEAIEKYEYYHSKEGVWPEVVHAARVSGIEKIKIYRYENRLVMIISLPADLTSDEMNRRYGSSSNRIQTWDALMKEFMQGPPGAKKGDTWVPMKLIHHYENGLVK